MKDKDDNYWMKKALILARKAASQNEVPVGAIIVKDNQLLSKAFNLKEKLQTPLAHAEVIAIHRASRKLKSWRLEDCTLYVTLEPCPMCCGVILQSRIKKVIFSTPDPKGGAASSLFNLLNDTRLNHQVEVIQGPLKEQSSLLLKKFFRKLRERKIKTIYSK